MAPNVFPGQAVQHYETTLASSLQRQIEHGVGDIGSSGMAEARLILVEETREEGRSSNFLSDQKGIRK
jgi:hypothetical protein